MNVMFEWLKAALNHFSVKGKEADMFQTEMKRLGEEKEMMQAVTNLKNAIIILGKHNTGLLQAIIHFRFSKVWRWAFFFLVGFVAFYTVSWRRRCSNTKAQSNKQEFLHFLLTDRSVGFLAPPPCLEHDLNIKEELQGIRVM